MRALVAGGIAVDRLPVAREGRARSPAFWYLVLGLELERAGLEDDLDAGQGVFEVVGPGEGEEAVGVTAACERGVDVQRGAADPHEADGVPSGQVHDQELPPGLLGEDGRFEGVQAHPEAVCVNRRWHQIPGSGVCRRRPDW